MKNAAIVAVFAGVSLFSPVLRDNVRAQEQAARMLDLSRAKSLPVWTAADARSAEDLSRQVRGINPSVFIIGHPKGGYGTGFVLSRRHRLLVTNAHVADIQKATGRLLAIANNTDDPFEIYRVWYHPGVLRKRHGDLVRSEDPSDGEIYACCPDVAILQVAGAREIPQELPLARPDEVFDAFAKPVAMLGYPGHDTVEWPGLGEDAKSSFRQGVIARATDFTNDAAANSRDLQYLQHTMKSWGGFSGSPVFLTNGRVLAVHNSGQTITEGQRSVTLSHGIRVDCIWELIAFHKLEPKVPVPVPVADLRLARFTVEDRRIREISQVDDLVARGRILTYEKRFDEAERLLSEAVQRMPNHAEACYRKGICHNRMATEPEQGNRKQQSRLAEEWIRKAVGLEPANIEYLLDWALMKANADNYEKSRFLDHPAIQEMVQTLLNEHLLSPEERGQALVTLGAAYANHQSRVDWFSKSIEAYPFNSGAFLSRANAYGRLRKTRARDADMRRKNELDAANAQYLQAWRLATSQDAAIRNGAKALQLAREACTTTNHRDWEHLSALAAAYAESGEFEQAVNWASKAYELAPEKNKSDVAAQRRKYRNGKPHRQ